MLNQWRVKKLYANIEYEVDELRRDTKICELAKDYGIQCNFVHDKLLVEPGMVKTQQGKPYAVFSPFHRSWIDALNKHLEWIVEAPVPESNDPSVRSDPTYSSLFDSAVPDHVAGFECKEKELMTTVWPAGNDSAKKVRWCQQKQARCTNMPSDPRPVFRHKVPQRSTRSSEPTFRRCRTVGKESPRTSLQT